MIGTRHSLDALETRVTLERALGRASQALLSKPTSDGLEVAMGELVEATGADYGYIERIEFAGDGTGVSEMVALAFANTSRLGRSDVFPGGPIEDFPTWVSQMIKDQVVEVSTVDLDGKERMLQEEYGIVSELVVAIYLHERWIGAVGIVNLEDRPWPEFSAEAMRRIADMVASYWEREQMTEALRAMIASKDEFLASVSHELRTPLTAVLGLAEILTDPKAQLNGRERDRFLYDIVQQSREMKDLIEDLLTFARADIGALHLDPVVLDLRGEIESVVGRLIHDNEADPRVVRRTGSGVAWGDPIRVRQIIRNLVSNAFRYGGPHIDITVTAVGPNTVEVAVADDGPDIDIELLEGLFEPYRRLHTSPTQPGSVGLGLSVSRKLARLMGGDLTASRAHGQTRFVMTLPTPG